MRVTPSVSGSGHVLCTLCAEAPLPETDQTINAAAQANAMRMVSPFLIFDCIRADLNLGYGGDELQELLSLSVYFTISQHVFGKMPCVGRQETGTNHLNSASKPLLLQT
jgi:hypothetical protein